MIRSELCSLGLFGGFGEDGLLKLKQENRMTTRFRGHDTFDLHNLPCTDLKVMDQSMQLLQEMYMNSTYWT